MNSDILFK